MARRDPNLAAGLLRLLGLAALALLGIVVAAVAFFPFERLAPALCAAIERETRIQTRIDALGASFTLHGPQLEASGVELSWPTGETLSLASVRVHAARPSAWVRGVPTVHVTTAAVFGAFAGDLSREAVRGDFAGFDFAQLPSTWFGDGGAALAGAVDAHVELARLAQQWSGTVKLTGGEGSLALPGSPIAIPYERLDAKARLDEVGTLHLDSLALAGPMVVAKAKGEVAAGYAGPATGEIAIEAEIERMDPALLPALAQYGIALDANGAGRLSISGKPDQIQIR